jgi:3-hydroxy-3-methylglutaryl CoA synthase
MTTRVGIEKIGVYPSSLFLAMPDLCEARGHNPADIRDVFMIDQRSLCPVWEDPVTMAVNAARSILDETDLQKIELLIVASESGVDQEKAMSTWVQRFLGLTPNCRNFEIKHACYGGTAGIQMAASWLASGLSRDAKALVIATDQSRTHFGKPWEFVLGAGAAAVLLSTEPRLVEFELGSNGYWTNEISDLTRPTAKVETGNSETSLIAYMDAFDGAYSHYLDRVKPAQNFDEYFKKNIYHAPFGGMTWRAHRTLQRSWKSLSRTEAWNHFERKSGAALKYLRRMGGTYSSSTFIGLVAMLESDEDIAAGDRISMFSYGSGSCAEFYSVKACPEARAFAQGNGIATRLDARRRLTVKEYEAVEQRRTDLIDEGDYETVDGSLDGWYDRHYRGRGMLVYRGMQDFYRQYDWS